LERPELVFKLICDSFIGEKIPIEMAEKIERDRLAEKKGEMGFAWFVLHGFKWEKVVDMDTQMLLNAARSGQKTCHQDPSGIKVPVLLTGSRADETVPGIEKIMDDLKKKSSMFESCLFDGGSHMTMLTRNYDFGRIAVEFFNGPAVKTQTE
jgi:pimeloyl-ACP methyl ester carboxylesterase